jgi:hypothetical protein
VEANDEFTFDLEEIEKKPLQWGGYAELTFEHLDIAQGAALSTLNFPGQPPTTIDRISPSLQIDGSWGSGISSFNWLLKAAGQQDAFGWIDTFWALIVPEIEAIATDELVQEQSAVILEAGRRASDLARRLHLSIGKATEDELQAVDINSIILQAVEVTRPRWHDEPESRGHAITLDTRLGDTLKRFRNLKNYYL